MSTSSHICPTSQLMGLALVASLLTGCSGGSSGSGAAGTGGGGAEAQLLRVDYGRLTDIYSFRRVDPSRGDRRDSENRSPVLIHREVVIDASIESQPLFDSVGEENITADFRFLPFDSETGHDELIILWDDRFEEGRFELALARAQTNLFEVAASYREQDIQSRPMPVVPRNAALVLTFDQDLDADLSFFAANPAAIQLLELRGDPNVMDPPDALFTLPFRILPQGRKLVIDTTILGDETQSTGNTTGGLPISHDNVTANIRLAIPSRGGVSDALRVGEDRIHQLNGIDSQGRDSVIRDFRSGNQRDGRVGALIDVETPMIVGDFEMGIIDIDPVEKIITLNKRFNSVPIRGRMPYVDGAIDGITGLPLGPGEVATIIPLRSGDILTQDVISPIGEIVRLRAEVLQNFSVGTVKGDPDLPALGRARDGTESENDTTVRIRVANLNAVDSDGNQVSFQSNNLPLGRPCLVRVHYYEFVPYASGGGEVSDSSRRAAFLVVDPPSPRLDENRNPIPPGTKIDPLASVAVRFNEPMDVDSVDRLTNFVITNSTIDGDNVATLIREDKPAALSIQDTRLLDLEGDGTLLNLSPRLGHHHVGPHNGNPGTAEQYWFHMLLGDDSPTDLAQNRVDLFDTRLSPAASFSVGYTLDEDTLDNFVASRVFRFASADEDGTAPGNLDMFGQFLLQDGSLNAAPTSRFSMTADSQNLGGILRHTRGECYSPTNVMTIAPAGHPGTLYQTPSMVGTGGVLGGVFGASGSVGAVIEPHQPRGSRLQMTYREEDFGLSQADPNQFMLDIEQMYWAPFNDSPVFFDRFDRYSLALGHADKRPDLRFFFTQGSDTANESCNLDCASLNSGLSTNFNANFLDGSSPVTVLQDKPYEINPNAAFRAASGIKYMPYPEFDRSYTWRDQRLVSWDTSLKQPTGLGGAQEPLGLFPNQDTTAFVDSPWGLDTRPGQFDQTIYALDEGDFWGNRTRDHGPVALPLLMDFQVFPDDGAFPVAQGVNAFHIALVGPGPLVPGGYYNSNPDAVCNLPFPLFRIHTSGGFDPNTGQDILINPAPVTVATGAWIKDAGLGDPTFGLFNAPAGEGHLHWAQADFVRKVSMVTFGFFDSLLPNQHGFAELEPPFPSEWAGVSDPGGFPNFMTLEADLGVRLRISDLVTSMDPPLEAQPAGTSVILEFRGVESIIGEEAPTPTLYDAGTDDRVKFRGNLLNPNYAADAFRYGKANAGAAGDTPRVKVEGMTPYAAEDQVDTIRDRFGLLPRYVNFRIIFENNVDTSPATNPALKGMAISFRMRVSN